MEFIIRRWKNFCHVSYKGETKKVLPDRVKALDEGFVESNAGDNTKREEQYLHGKKLFFCLISLYFSLFLVGLDQTIVVTVIEVVSTKFDDGFNKKGWLASGFLLAMAVCTASWGRFSIIFGRKICLCSAIIIFEVGSLISGLANSMDLLIAGRIICGLGGGGIQTLVYIVIAEIVPINKRTLFMALVGCTFAVSTALGPIIGGAFTSYVTWRWCFYINLPVGGSALVLLFFSFNPPRPRMTLKEKLLKIDYIGVFLLTTGLVLFLVALSLGASGERQWRSGALISMLTVGGLLFIIFWIWSLWFSKEPMFNPKVITSAQVSACAASIFGMMFCFIALQLYLVVYFQSVRNDTSFKSGLELLPGIILTTLSSIIVGLLIQKTRLIKPFMILGGILCPVGPGVVCLLNLSSPSPKRIGLTILYGIPCGILLQAGMISLQISAPKIDGGTIMATSYVNFARALGGSLAGVLGDVVFSSSFLSALKKALSHENKKTILTELESLDLQNLIQSSAGMSELSLESQNFIKTQMMKAIRCVFYVCIGSSGVALIACLFTTNKKLPKK